MKRLLVLLVLALMILFVEALNARGMDTKQADKLTQVCLAHKGYPYVWGGESRNEGGYDCSGFVYSVAKKMGHPIPRSTSLKYWFMLSDAVAGGWAEGLWGDLVWFTFSAKRPYGHIGILTGPSTMWQSGSSTGPTESIFAIGNYWARHFAGCKRFLRACRDPTE